MERVWRFLNVVLSIVIAVLRLMLLTLCFITSGLQNILFNRTEIYTVEMKGLPWRCDKNDMDEKLSYVDKLMLNNPDLMDFPNEPLTEEEMRTLEDLDNEDEREDGDDGDESEGI